MRGTFKSLAAFCLGTSALVLGTAVFEIGPASADSLYGLDSPSIGNFEFGQINPTSGAFTSISQLPTGITIPLEVTASNPISGEYYFGANPSSSSFNTLAVNGSTGAYRYLNSGLTILGFDVSNDLIVASKLDASGNHIVTIDPVTQAQTQLPGTYAPASQSFSAGGTAVNSIGRQAYVESSTGLLVVNLDTGALIRSVPLSQNTAGMPTWDPVTGVLYDFASPAIGDFRLASINTTTGQVTTISASNVLSGGISSQGRSLSVVGNLLYVQSLNGTFDIVDLTNGALRGTFTSSAISLFPQDQVVLGGSSNTTFPFAVQNANAAIIKVGPGTTVLTADNQNGAGTVIMAGVLQLGNGGTAGSVSGNIVNNGSLVFDRSDAFSFAGAISGSGSLSQSGPGTLVLTGANSYTGGTTISAGTLQLGTPTMTGSLTGDVLDNAKLEFDRSDSSTFAGNISGSGIVWVAGGGTVILTGNNSYAADTTVFINANLQAGNGGTMGSLPNGLIHVGGGAVTFDRSDSYTFSGSITDAVDGTGLLGRVAVIGSGTTIFTGANTYSGGTTISAGTLQIGNGGASGSLTGNIADNGALAFNRSDSVTFSGAISGSGGLNQLGSGILILTGANTYTGTTTVNAGTLEVGLGASLASTAVNINSGGTLQFDGSFTPTSTKITVNSGGTLLSHSFGTTQLAGSKIIMAGGLLDTVVSGGDVTVGSIEGAGTINLRNNSLTVGGLNANTTLAATVAGTFSQLNKIGTGTLTLTGANTYPNGVSVNGGGVVLGATGSLTTGSLSVRAGGQFVTAASTSIGNLFIDGGTIAAAPGTTLNFTNNVDFFSPGPVVFGSPTLTGTITVAAPGCCIPFSPTIEIAGGTVRDLTSPPFPGDGNGALSFAAYMAPLFTVDAGATVDFNDHSVRYAPQSSKGMNLRGAGQILLGTSATTEMQLRSTSFSGIISGAGKVTFLSNASTQLLTGNNTYTGGTTINSGASVQLGSGGTSGSITGNVANNGALAFDRSDNIAFAGVISGAGALTQSGSGVLTLSGTNAYSGATSVGAGTLNVTGSIASSSVTVASGATLTGTGKVGTTTIVSGGTLNPGSSTAPGTLTVNGSLVLASGTNYLDAVTPTAAGLTSVSGTASINGTVVANIASGTYSFGQRFALVTATGGVSGTFASLTGIPFTLRAQLSYDTNNAYLTLSPNALAPLTSNTTGNQGNVIGAIDKSVAAGNVPPPGFVPLYTLSGPALNNAIDQISGQASPNVVNAVGQASLSFMTMTASGGAGETGGFAPGSAYGAAAAPHRAQLGAGQMRVWGAAYGGHAGLSGDSASGAASLSSNNVGMIAGADVQVADGILAGLTLGLGRQTFRSGNGSGDSDDLMLGLYGRADAGAAYIAASLGLGWHRIETLRIVTVSGTDILQGKENAHDVGGRVEAGWRLPLEDGFTVIPFGAFAGDSFENPAFAETALSGASSFALSYAAQTTTLGRSELGVRLDRNYALEQGVLTADVRAGWAHQLDDLPLVQASFQNLPGASFQVAGVRPARDGALLGLDLEVRNSSGLFFGVRGEGQFGAGSTVMEGMGNFGWRW